MGDIIGRVQHTADEIRTGRVTYSMEDAKRIQAASFHDVPVKAETPVTPAIEIERIDAFDRTLTHLIYESDNCILDLYIHRETPDIVNIDNQDFTFEIAVCDLPAWIALLQRAQQIIEGGKEP